eukprot:1365774-Amorphochlora_amoeboformis.AAC.1
MSVDPKEALVDDLDLLHEPVRELSSGLDGEKQRVRYLLARPRQQLVDVLGGAHLGWLLVLNTI